MSQLGPIELEVLRNALTAAAAEMDVTIWRTSRSTIVRELLDYSTAIFDRNGWNVAQAARIPSHLNSMSYFLTEILARHIPPDRWGPDDIVVSNDPYCGGQHLPDIVAFKAIFRNGRRIGFVGALCHHLDVGGSSPGSYGSSATEIFQEGLRIPPVKLVEGGKLNEPIRDIILQNVRQPDILWGDLQSQLASLHIGAASVERLATKLGEVRFEAALRQLLDRSEAAMRAVIGRIPDGTYEFEDHIDDDGISDAPLRIHAKLMIDGEELTVDLSGCSKQAMGPSNATLSSTCSTVFYALIASADVPIAANAGCYRPVRIVAPPGLCVSAAAPAPVVHRIAIGHRLATVLFGALPVSDGASALSFGMHNNANIPMEMIESDMPVTFMGYGLLTDTGGPGRCGGGWGLWREWRINCAMAQLSTNLDRFKFRPFGLAGGEPAAPSALYLVRDGQTQALCSKVTNMMLKSGDIIRLETSGGGGFGEARLRARELVERDVRLGYVSAAAAKLSYGENA